MFDVHDLIIIIHSIYNVFCALFWIDTSDDNVYLLSKIIKTNKIFLFKENIIYTIQY